MKLKVSVLFSVQLKFCNSLGSCYVTHYYVNLSCTEFKLTEVLDLNMSGRSELCNAVTKPTTEPYDVLCSCANRHPHTVRRTPIHLASSSVGRMHGPKPLSSVNASLVTSVEASRRNPPWLAATAGQQHPHHHQVLLIRRPKNAPMQLLQLRHQKTRGWMSNPQRQCCLITVSRPRTNGTSR